MTHMDPPLTEIKTPRKDNDMEFKYPAIPPAKVSHFYPKNIYYMS